MDGPKILEVISVYRKYFIEKGIGITDFPHTDMPSSEHEILAHCHGMLDKMEGFVREGRIEKAFRWLGFIQGCLWSTRQYSLEELMNHSRPKERYSLLVEGDFQEENFLNKLEKKAKKCGDITITSVSQSELAIEGENDALTKFFIWLLRSSCLKKVRYLKPES